MIHITAFLKTICLRGNPKMLKNDIFDKSDYKYNSNSMLWPILAGYLTLMMHFDNLIQDAGEPKITPLNC